MRLISYFVLLLMVVVLTSYQRKPAEDTIQRWIQSLTRESKKTIVDNDFSNILLDRRVPYVGYIGANYQKLSITFQRVHRTSANRYSVSGVTIVKNNRCNFRGTINIIDNRRFIHPTYGVDDAMKGRFRRRGCSVAKYKLMEDTRQKSSGVFSGYLLFYWYETVDGRIVYDDIDDYSDSFCNNQYAGSWRSNSTRKAKPCAWGQYRVPFSGDLDIGAGEFSVNPKYAKYGWEK